MRTAIGVILWSFMLVMLYRNAPRSTRHAAKLLRFGIGCFSLIVPVGIWVHLRPTSAASTGTVSAVMAVLGGGGMFFGMVCTGLALILDAKRRDP
jgi:hypothetical protein